MQVKTRLEVSQAAADAATGGETLRLNGNRTGGAGDTDSLAQKMESCCT